MKAWNLIQKLNNDPAIPKHQHYPVTANQVAHQPLVNGQTKEKKAPGVKFRKTEKQNMEPNLTSQFTAQEFSNGIAALKNGQAIAFDGISGWLSVFRRTTFLLSTVKDHVLSPEILHCV